MTPTVGMGGGPEQSVRSVAAPRPEPRLVRASHQFEAQMMKELLEPMTRPGALCGDSDGNETGVLGEFASESLAGALSAGGGFGIADRIVHTLSHSGNRSEMSPVIGNAQINTRMSLGK
jgi:Rod binding domain-containing protein